MKRFKPFFSLLLSLSLLAGCAKTQPAAAGQGSAAAEIPLESRPLAGDLSMLQGFGGFANGGFGKEGLYHISPYTRPDGSLNLAYADYESLQTVLLCAAPGCTHDNPSCTSYFPRSPGGVLPEVVGDQLLLVCRGSWTYAPEDSGFFPRIEAANLDGSNRKVLAEFRANQAIDTPMLTDGESLFFRLSTYTATEETAELIRLDTATGAMEVLRAMDASRCEFIWGCSGKDIILSRYKESITGQLPGSSVSDIELWREDAVSQEAELLFSWSAEEAYPSLYEDTLLYQNPDDRFFHALSVSTGEDVCFSQYKLPDKGDSHTSVQVLDGNLDHIAFSETTWEPDPSSEKTISHRTYSLLCADGTTKPWPFTFDSGGDIESMWRITEVGDDQYCLMIGVSHVDLSYVDEEGLSSYSASMEQSRALIDKEDYWNGVANFREIAPLGEELKPG